LISKLINFYKNNRKLFFLLNNLFFLTAKYL